MTEVEKVDAVVVGAGLGGCAAALGLARQGAQVLVLEPHPERTDRLSGEWLHPAGVSALTRLGLSLSPPDFVHHKGFVLHPGRDQSPVCLPYAWGTAASAPHHAFVGRIQEALGRQTGVQFATGRRFLRLTTGGCLTDGGRVAAGLIVGADGRSSAVRKALRPDGPPPVALSWMAGLTLPRVGLPAEDFGHVFLGGPGPVLAYRISPDLVRITLDVPLTRPEPGRLSEYLQRRYAPHLPGDLAAALCARLRRGGIQWAANTFRRRDDFGRGRVALVGDAAGHGHPLAAQGMTCTLLDAECLAAQRSLASYRQLRTAQSRVPERVAAAIHRACTGEDRATRALLDSLLAVWQADPRERARTMRLLGVEEHRLAALSGSVAHIAAGALAHCGGNRRNMLESALTVGGLVGWLGWLGGPHVGVPPQRTGRKVAFLAL